MARTPPVSALGAVKTTWDCHEAIFASPRRLSFHVVWRWWTCWISMECLGWVVLGGTWNTASQRDLGWFPWTMLQGESTFLDWFGWECVFEVLGSDNMEMEKLRFPVCWSNAGWREAREWRGLYRWGFCCWIREEWRGDEWFQHKLWLKGWHISQSVDVILASWQW